MAINSCHHSWRLNDQNGLLFSDHFLNPINVNYRVCQLPKNNDLLTHRVRYAKVLPKKMYNRECQNYPELRHRAATADRYYLAQNLLHNNWKPELFLNTPAMESATYYRVPQHKM